VGRAHAPESLLTGTVPGGGGVGRGLRVAESGALRVSLAELFGWLALRRSAPERQRSSAPERQGPELARAPVGQ
jgi:hypothetical protein